jgi:hypothetical protein
MPNILYTDIHGKSHTVKRKEEKPKAVKPPKKTKPKKKSGGLFGKIFSGKANKTSRKIWRKLI